MTGFLCTVKHCFKQHSKLSQITNTLADKINKAIRYPLSDKNLKNNVV